RFTTDYLRELTCLRRQFTNHTGRRCVLPRRAPASSIEKKTTRTTASGNRSQPVQPSCNANANAAENARRARRSSLPATIISRERCFAKQKTAHQPRQQTRNLKPLLQPRICKL